MTIFEDVNGEIFAELNIKKSLYKAISQGYYTSTEA